MAYVSLQLLFVFVSCCVVSTIALSSSIDDPTCNVVSAANESVTVVCPLGMAGVTWSKNGIKIVTEEDKYTVDSENGTLVIVKIGEAVVGDYVCTIGNRSSTLVICSVPYVRDYDKAKNVIEGDPFQVECKAWGFPQVSVLWYFGSSVDPLSSDSRTSFRNGSVENSTVRMENMADEDAGNYMCVVSNSVGFANVTLEVSVKDKYAALWPFIGICIEVFVLCAIIYVYERRRTKKLAKEAQTEETEYMTTAANNDSKGGDEVRQRK